MWYTKLSVFQITSPCPSFDEFTQALTQKSSESCPAHQWQQLGWCSPYPKGVQNEALVHAHHQYLSAQVCLSQRLLPTSIIQQHTEEAIADFIARVGEAPKNAEKKKLKESTINQLLPKAFVKKTFCPLYIDTQRSLLFINSTSQSMIENVVAMLRQSLGGLALLPMTFTTTLDQAMTTWLLEETAPEPWVIGHRCTIADPREQQTQCTFKGQSITHPYIYNHLEQNRKVTELALEWPEHIRFQLKANGMLSGIKYLDGIQTQLDDLELDESDAMFRANFMLMTDTFDKLWQTIIKACGGFRHDGLQNEENSVMVEDSTATV